MCFIDLFSSSCRRIGRHLSAAISVAICCHCLDRLLLPPHRSLKPATETVATACRRTGRHTLPPCWSLPHAAESAATADTLVTNPLTMLYNSSRFLSMVSFWQQSFFSKLRDCHFATKTIRNLSGFI